MSVQKITKSDILAWLSLVNQEIEGEENNYRQEQRLIKNFAKENGLDPEKLCDPNKSEEEWDDNDDSIAAELEDLRFDYCIDILNPLLAQRTALELLKYNIAKTGKTVRRLHQSQVFEKLDALKNKEDGEKIKDTIIWLQAYSLTCGDANNMGDALAEYGIKFYDEVYGNALHKEWRSKDKTLKTLEDQGKTKTEEYKCAYKEMKNVGMEMLRFKTKFGWRTGIVY
ncbi:MAG: hypothetical protein FWC61_00545 [Proteobacteria bacterium]|nr:hypothetical protein [Pseudomonadota bacterium]